MSGRRLPAYCTSIGHAMLAHLPQAELDAFLARGRFHAYTEHTPNTAEKLTPLLDAVRESGFAFASQMMEPRICTLAVPVRDAGGHYVAGINVILQGRLFSRREMAERYFHPLQDAAHGTGFAAAAVRSVTRASCRVAGRGRAGSGTLRRE